MRLRAGVLASVVRRVNVATRIYFLGVLWNFTNLKTSSVSSVSLSSPEKDHSEEKEGRHKDAA